VWAAIRAASGRAGVVIALGSGSGGRCRGVKLGDFAGQRWQRSDDQLPESFLGGEGLGRGSRAMLGTLLQEGAHGVASTREIRDTSRQGRSTTPGSAPWPGSSAWTAVSG
jgi:hypothetical protein